MINYNEQLHAVKQRLRKMRDDAKKNKDTPFDLFYFETAATLRQEFHVQVSAGWVREQCTKDTDPSYLRIGALMNFLDKYQAVKEAKKRETRPAVHAPSDNHVPTEEEDNALFEQLKAQVQAEKAMKKERKPNALVRQLAVQKIKARPLKS